MPKDIARMVSAMAVLTLLLSTGPTAALSTPKFGSQQDKTPGADATKKDGKSDSSASTTLTITIKLGERPVEGALVEVTSREQGISYSKSVHTNKQGVVELLKVPRGKILIQVSPPDEDRISESHVLKQPEETIMVQLKGHS
jgi:hypothetical protein